MKWCGIFWTMWSNLYGLLLASISCLPAGNKGLHGPLGRLTHNLVGFCVSESLCRIPAIDHIQQNITWVRGRHVCVKLLRTDALFVIAININLPNAMIVKNERQLHK